MDTPPTSDDVGISDQTYHSSAVRRPGPQKGAMKLEEIFVTNQLLSIRAPQCQSIEFALVFLVRATAFNPRFETVAGLPRSYL